MGVGMGTMLGHDGWGVVTWLGHSLHAGWDNAGSGMGVGMGTMLGRAGWGAVTWLGHSLRTGQCTAGHTWIKPFLASRCGVFKKSASSRNRCIFDEF